MKSTLGDDWESMTRGTLAGLRRDAAPFAPRLKEIVDELSDDSEFRRLWARYDVSGTEDAPVHMLVEGIGSLEIEVQNFGVRSMPGYLLTVLSATAEERGFRTLRAPRRHPDPARRDAGDSGLTARVPRGTTRDTHAVGALP